jgi:hypothetical protein
MSDPSAIFAESLAAMVGIFPSRAPTEIEVRGAKNYLARCRRRIAKFLDTDELGPVKWDRPPSQESLWEKITTPLDPKQFAEWATEADLGVAEGVLYPAVIQAAHDHIKSLWPIYPDTSLGLHVHELAFDEYLDVWHIARTLNDPEKIFDALDAMVLLPDQVAAIGKVYPALYEAIRALTMVALEPFIEVQGAVDRRKVLPGERETQLRVLLGVADEDSFEVTRKEEKPAEAPKPPARDKASEDERTPSEMVNRQRIASK